MPSGLARPARQALPAAGYVTLEQLTQVTEADLARMHGIGPKAIAQLGDALAAAGLELRHHGLIRARRPASKPCYEPQPAFRAARGSCLVMSRSSAERVVAALSASAHHQDKLLCPDESEPRAELDIPLVRAASSPLRLAVSILGDSSPRPRRSRGHAAWWMLFVACVRYPPN